MTNNFNPSKVHHLLLAWYDANRRDLPWRAPPGGTTDPYSVWLSEIMLQQTTVVTVGPYFVEFMARWPDVKSLAGAYLDDVLHAWQGLGYYARARNLHKCAGVVAGEFGGKFPSTEKELRRLPGIGPYTAAAVAAIAFDCSVMPVDGNVERVVSRLYAIEGLPASAKKSAGKFAAGLGDSKRPGDFAQAMMDLGATVCRPKQPTCGSCPLCGGCQARIAGTPEAYPVKAAKPARPVRRGVAFWIERSDGAVLLRRRPERGLLGGMMEFPSTDWREPEWPLEEAVSMAPIETQWCAIPGMIRHTFTHFHLEITVLRGQVKDNREPGGNSNVWSPPSRFSEHALPTIMKKVARHVRGQAQN